MNPTHRCKVCNALWSLNGPTAVQPEGSWSLVSRTCGKCCDNVAMGEQIEAIKSAQHLAILELREALRLLRFSVRMLIEGRRLSQFGHGALAVEKNWHDAIENRIQELVGHDRGLMESLPPPTLTEEDRKWLRRQGAIDREPDEESSKEPKP